jgi:hypothetical protein
MQSSAIRWREGTKRCAALFREGEMVGGISGGSVVDVRRTGEMVEKALDREGVAGGGPGGV